MEKAIILLDEVKESIINAYETKSHLSRNKIAKLMSDETWLNAKKAHEMGFVDGILFAEKKQCLLFPKRKNRMKNRKRRYTDRNDLFKVKESICILIQSICISRIRCRHTH